MSRKYIAHSTDISSSNNKFDTGNEYWLDEPQYEDSVEHEVEHQIILFPIVLKVLVDEDKSVEYDVEDATQEVIKYSSDSRGNWLIDGDMYVDGMEFADVESVLDAMDLLLKNKYKDEIPETPGEYEMSGELKLLYMIDGIVYVYDDELEFHAENIRGRFNANRSSIHNIKFEPVATEVSSSDNVDSSLQYVGDEEALPSGQEYDVSQTVKYKGKQYNLKYTEVNTDENQASIEIYNDFKAQITETHPYDDAEYAWAVIEYGIIRFVKGGTNIDSMYYMTSDDIGCENSEWCDVVVNMALEALYDLNKNVSSRMQHN